MLIIFSFPFQFRVNYRVIMEIESLKTGSDNLGPWIFASLISCGVLTFIIVDAVGSPFASRRKAEAKVCSAMAVQVVQGQKTAFDYMVTSCSPVYLAKLMQDQNAP